MRVPSTRDSFRRTAAAHCACACTGHVAGLLLLDEPLSALDAIERVRLRGEIRALQQRLGLTTIMVTHDQEEALSMADRIVVMNAGRIEQVGTPRQVYEAPATPFVADFVGKINVLPAVTEGGRRCRVGALSLAVSGDDLPAGSPVKLYLRPEDVGVHVNWRSAAGRVARARLRASSSSARSATWCSRSIPRTRCPWSPTFPRQAVDSARLAPGLAVSVSLPAAALRVLS
jgi:ABC-type Fe3+/spermidine/putrescine transport system ATPase subunit